MIGVILKINVIIYKIICLILSFYILNTHISMAQNKEDSLGHNLPKISFIDDFNDKINIKLDVESDFETFDLKGDNFEYDIRPNIATKSKVHFSYKFISFSFSYIPKFFPGNNDDNLKGETTGKGFALNLNLNHWIQDLKYNNVEGFYLHNSYDFDPNWENNTSPYLLFPDLKVTSFKGSTSYKFNSDFSLKAISTQTEIQLKSAGSFIPGILYSFYNIDNRSNSPDQQTSQRSESYELMLNLAYYYTFVINKSWYTSFGISPSAGINHTNLLTRFPDENIKTDYSDSVFRINGRSGIGYNSKQFFGGAEIIGYKSFRNENNTGVSLATTGITYQVFIGYRFNTPDFIKNFVDNLETKISL